MAAKLQPLDQKFAITDANGNPTDYFIRWAQQRQIDITGSLTPADLQDYLAAHKLIAGTGIQLTPDGNIASGVTIHADAQAILDEITSTRGAVIYRGALGWAALVPGTSGQFLQTAGAGADPLWAPAGSTAVFTATANGLAPLSGGGTVNFLRADGSWVAPPVGPTYTNFTSTTAGLTPASGGGTVNFLRADGSWAAPPSGGAYTPPTGTGYPHITTGAQDAAALTPAQVTADLNLATASLKGLVPASGGGTTNFLRADFTWAAPPSGGGGGGSVVMDKAAAYLATATNTANTGWQKIPLDTVSYDSNSIWDTTNKRFIPKKAGYYLCNLRARVPSATGALAIGKNGSQTFAVGNDTGGNTTAIGGSDIIYCNGSTDYLEMFVYSGVASAITTGTFDTHMSVVGPIDVGGGASGGAGLPLYYAGSSTAVSYDPGTGNVVLQNCSISIPASNVARTFKVDYYWKGTTNFSLTHAVRSAVGLDGALISTINYQGYVAGNGEAAYSNSFAFVTVPGDNAAHTIDLMVSDSNNTGSLTFVDRYIYAQQIPASGGSIGGGGGGKIAPTLVQKATLRNDGNIVLPAAPTVGNTLVLVTAGWGQSLPGYVPAGFTNVGYYQSTSDNGVDCWFRDVVAGDSATWALSASDNQAAVMYEYSGVGAIGAVRGGAMSGFFSGANFTLPVPYPTYDGTDVMFAVVETDNAAYWSATAATGLTVDYAVPNDTLNHTSLFVRYDKSLNKSFSGSTTASPVNPVYGVYYLTGKFA